MIDYEDYAEFKKEIVTMKEFLEEIDGNLEELNINIGTILELLYEKLK